MGPVHFLLSLPPFPHMVLIKSFRPWWTAEREQRGSWPWASPNRGLPAQRLLASKSETFCVCLCVPGALEAPSGSCHVCACLTFLTCCHRPLGLLFVGRCSLGGGGGSEPEAQRGAVTWPGPHSGLVAELGQCLQNGNW